MTDAALKDFVVHVADAAIRRAAPAASATMLRTSDPRRYASNALSQEQKIKALQALVQDQINRRPPAMLAPAKP